MHSTTGAGGGITEILITAAVLAPVVLIFVQIPRLRRRKKRAGLPVHLTGRHAREFAREYARASQQAPGKTGTAANGALTRTGWRWRRHMPPFAWGAGLAALGAILHATPHPLVYGIIAGVGAPVVMVWSTRHLSAFAKRATDVAAGITSLWLPSLAALGFTKPIPALLALTWAPCAGLWVRHYRWRPEVAAKPEIDMSDAAIWDRLAARRKWDAWLTDPEAIPGGVKWQIGMNGVETHIGNILSQPKAIAAAYDRPQTEAYIEPHPSGIESKGVFTRLKGGTLEEIREWDGQGISEDGIAVIGRFADSRPARIRFWHRRDGTRHGLIAGASGAGKSVLLDLIVWQAITSPVPVVPVILDPQNGQSLPQWRGKVPYAAGVPECIAMLTGLHAGMMRRSRDLADMVWAEEDGYENRGLPFFDPALTGLPVILIIIDEAPVMLAGDGNAKLGAVAIEFTGQIAKLGRKTGVSLWPVAQVPSLSELGDQVVRSMLVGGNVVCLRTGDRVSAGMLGLDTDPSALPKVFPSGEPTGGLGYVVGPDIRQAPFRVSPVPAAMRRAIPPVPEFDERYAEVMRSGMFAFQDALAVSSSVPEASSPAADDAPEGRRCVDAVWRVLRASGREMERGEIMAEANRITTEEWGREKGFVVRAFTDAFRDLASGKYPDRPVVKPRDGVYEALAPRGGTPADDHEREGA